MVINTIKQLQTNKAINKWPKTVLPHWQLLRHCKNKKYVMIYISMH